MALLAEVHVALSQTLAESVDNRPSRRQPRAGPQTSKVACRSCKDRKMQCFGTTGETCPRCVAKGLSCEYPARSRPGPKASNAKYRRLQQANQQLEKALNLLYRPIILQIPPLSSPPSTSPERAPKRRSVMTTSPERPGGSDPGSQALKKSGGVEDILENPLAVLAHLSTLDMRDPEDTGHYPSELAAERYFSAGLYQSISDANPALDPVRLGLLTEDDFERLVTFFFREMSLFFWILTPSLHTPSFIRSISPFLATALAATAAQFCPFSGHLTRGLEAHARYLSTRIFMEGLKSIEIVQGYLFLAHWISPTEYCIRDESWSLTGIALRMGSELRLDRPLDLTTFEGYGKVATLPDDAFALLARDRSKTVATSFCLDLCLPVLTGRMTAIPGTTLIGRLEQLPESLDPSDPDYNRIANLTLNKYFAKALNLAAGLQAENGEPDPDLRDAFNASWREDLASWSQGWPFINHFIQVHSLNLRTILLSVSLRFAGPTEPILAECEVQAAATLRVVAEWMEVEHSLLYASNYVIVDIGYSAVLLLKFMSLEDSHDNGTWSDRKAACSKVADALEQIGLARLHSASLAILHAARIRTLLRRLEGKQRPAVEPVPEIPRTEPSSWEENENAQTTDFVGWFMTDPMLWDDPSHGWSGGAGEV